MKTAHFALGSALAIATTAAVSIALAPRAQALPSTGTGTVTGRVLDWPSNHLPLAGCRVELRSGIGNQLIAVRQTNSGGYFTFSNVQTSTNQSFHVVASPSSHAAHWYFTLNPGQTRNQNPLILAFWP